MAKTIWKYDVSQGGIFHIPIGAKILSVQAQQCDVCLWMLVDPDSKLEQRHFQIYGTGHPIPEIDDLEYIGTAVLNGLPLVWHVFEVIADENR